MFTILIHGQTSRSTVLGKWYAKFRTGKFRPGVAFTICTNQFHLSRPETGIKDGFDGFQEMEHKFLLAIFCPEKQDHLFKFSVALGSFLLERPKKVCFIYFPTGFSGNFL